MKLNSRASPPNQRSHITGQSPGNISSCSLTHRRNAGQYEIVWWSQPFWAEPFGRPDMEKAGSTTCLDMNSWSSCARSICLDSVELGTTMFLIASCKSFVLVISNGFPEHTKIGLNTAISSTLGLVIAVVWVICSMPIPHSSLTAEHYGGIVDVRIF